MIRKGLLTLIFFCFIVTLSAQSWKALKSNEAVEVKYKWKENKSGKEELRIKFKNTSKKDQNVDLEIGFYEAGVMNERAQVNTCLKKGFFSNLFRNWHVIIPEKGSTTKSLSSFELEVTEFKTEKIDKCEITEP